MAPTAPAHPGRSSSAGRPDPSSIAADAACRYRNQDASATLATERPTPLSPATPPYIVSRPREAQDQELVFLAEIAHALASTESLEVILPLILDRTRLLLGCEAAAVVGIGPDRQQLVVLASDVVHTEARELRGRTYPRAGTMADRALVERLPLPITPTGPAAFDPVVQLLTRGQRPGNGVVLPLRASGAERGGLIVLDKPGPFAPEDLRLLIALADQTALAIDRAELRRTRLDDAARLKVLNAVLQVTSAGFEEEALIRRSMEALLSAAPAERAELVTRDGGEIRVRFRHVPAPAAPGRAEVEAGQRSLLARVLERGEPMLVRDGWGGGARDGAAAACIPLKARDRVVGALHIARRAPAMDEHELEMLAAVGRHLGTAIELSRVFRRAVTEAEQLERVCAERQAKLEEAQERLGRAQWLASLGELAAGVAHDLNNALNPIVAFAELIREHAAQADKVRTYAERILMAAQGGAETVRRIQRFTRRRLESLPFETLGVGALVGQVIELSRPLWTTRTRGKPVEVIESVEPELLVEGNAGELRQALLNLIGNALDAMPKGGTIRFVGRAEGEQVVLAVQDTGTGMSEAVQERALEPFFTTKGTHGTGLGLAEVYGIARRHGGHLELDSWMGIGTTVLLRLPRARTALQPAAAARARGGGGRLLQILLVDDNLLSLEATAASLRSAGHAVATAPNARTALQLFGTASFDLVLSDLGLPDMSGWDLVDQLRLMNPEVRLGVITGWALPEGDEGLREHGIELVFVKPVDPDQLLAAL